MNPRALKIAAISLLAGLFVLAPDADAQRGRGRRGGGRGGARRALGRAKPKPAAPTPAPKAKPEAPIPVPKGGQLKAAEDQFRAMLARIDRAIEESERRRDGAAFDTSPVGREMPRDIERGTLEWRALQKPVFMTVDYDHNGWLSFRETREALGFDRAEYALYDRDHDARVTLREFVTRYDEVVAQTGAFRIPIPDPSANWDKGPSPATMRNEFDADADGALDSEELSRLLARWKRSEWSADSLLEKLDVDGDGKLGHGELATLSHLSESSFLLSGDGRAKPKSTTSLVELFGKSTPRTNPSGGGSLPPLVAGPLPHFARLDTDHDGFITQNELVKLQDGSGILTRAGAVLAALDQDGDGRLSDREFAAGFTRPPTKPTAKSR